MLDRGIPHPFSNAHSGTVDAGCSTLDGSESVGEIESAVTMPVPVDADLCSQLPNQLLDPGDEIEDPFGYCGTHGVTEADPPGSGLDGSGQQDLQMLGVRTDGVFGDIHHRQTFTDREFDCVAGVAQNAVEIPVFGILPDRAAADKNTGFDRYAGLLADVGNRLDVDHQRPCRTVGPDIEPVFNNLSAQSSHGVELSFPRPRQSHVGGLDAETLHQMEQLDLDL